MSKPKAGGQVEMFDGSHKGTITEVQSDYCLFITWDDGQTGHVHPDDVKHLTDDKAPVTTPAPLESEAYYQNMIAQLTRQLDQVTDEISHLTSNKKDLALSLEDIRSEYLYHYPATMEGLQRKLEELDPEKEGEEYEGKRAGILAQLEALADSEYCKAHDC